MNPLSGKWLGAFDEDDLFKENGGCTPLCGCGLYHRVAELLFILYLKGSHNIILGDALTVILIFVQYILLSLLSTHSRWRDLLTLLPAGMRWRPANAILSSSGSTGYAAASPMASLYCLFEAEELQQALIIYPTISV